MTKGNIDNLILQRLEQWKQNDGSLPQSLEFYEQLIRLQIEVYPSITKPAMALSPEVTASRLKQGTPLLKFQDLMLDWNVVRDYLIAITNILYCYVTENMGNIKWLTELSSDIPRLQQIARVWYCEKSISPSELGPGVTELFLRAVLQTILRPFLSAHSEILHNLIDQDLWRYGICPICGGKPDFSFLDRERGARWLLCSRCEAEWLFQRLECPCCGTRDNKKLSYRTDDREFYRLYTCDDCRSYIKAVDMRKAEGEVLLPLERIITLDLDKQAVDDGYHSG